MPTAVDRQLNWEAPAAVPAHAGSDPFWRSLFYFNVYRVAAAVLLLLIASALGENGPIGSRDSALYVYVTGFYCAFSALCFVLIRIRWRFDLQLTMQVAADVMFIVMLTYASQGISSGLGLLLLTTLAAAGLIARGRLTLFYASLGAVGVLLEHTYEVLHYDAPIAQFAQAGLLSAGYFATAWVTHTLARYAVASEELAAQREVDLENMAQVSEHVIQDMHDGVLVVDGVGVIRQFNTRAERMLGPLWGRRDVSLRDYSPMLAAKFESWRENLPASAATGDITSSRAVDARFVPVGRQRKAGAVIFLEDLTRIQSEARQMKLAALGRLTANIAHEIRNPLGAISHAAELLQEEPVLNETSQRLITIIQDNSQRLDRMVNDVLRLRRSDAAHREVFKLVDYLKTFVEQFCQIEKLAPDTFRIELRADPFVQFDRSHLNQVMWNLCRNAARHCRGGKRSIQIVVSDDEQGDVVRLDVIDDGPGVPAELRSHLFEPFFTTAASGTGLGLYIAREVCEANNAKLDYIEATHGACFSVLCRAGSAP